MSTSLSWKRWDFSVPDGQLIGLIGLNGAGKSTTINEIIGLLHPYAGEVRIDGLSLPEAPTDYRKKSAIFQKPLAYMKN